MVLRQRNQADRDHLQSMQQQAGRNVLHGISKCHAYADPPGECPLRPSSR